MVALICTSSHRLKKTQYFYPWKCATNWCFFFCWRYGFLYELTQLFCMKITNATKSPPRNRFGHVSFPLFSLCWRLIIYRRGDNTQSHFKPFGNRSIAAFRKNSQFSIINTLPISLLSFHKVVAHVCNNDDVLHVNNILMPKLHYTYINQFVYLSHFQ